MGLLRDLLVGPVLNSVIKTAVAPNLRDKSPSPSQEQLSAADLEALRRHDEECRKIILRRERQREAIEEHASWFSVPTMILMLLIGITSGWPLGVFGFLILTIVVTMIAHSFGGWVGRVSGIERYL